MQSNTISFPTRTTSMTGIMNTNNTNINTNNNRENQSQQGTSPWFAAAASPLNLNNANASASTGGGLDHAYHRLRTRTMSSIATNSYHRDVALEVHELVYGSPATAAVAASSSTSLTALQRYGAVSVPSVVTHVGGGGSGGMASVAAAAAAHVNPASSPPPLTAGDVMASLERLYEPNAIYENPLVTATSREMILDIHNLSRRMAGVEIARPRTLLAWLFGWRRSSSSYSSPFSAAKGRNGEKSGEQEQEQEQEPAWFEALRCWSEIGDIVAESEGWDGTRRSVIEHTLHILLLPNLHTPATSSSSSSTRIPLSPSASHTDLYPLSSNNSNPNAAAAAIPPSSSSTSFFHGLTHPVLAFRGVSLPTPFHLQLRIITKLTFNEQGRVSAHRDFWDVKDLVGGLVPGARAAQWVLTRLAARGFATASWLLVGDWTVWGGRKTRADGGHRRDGEGEYNEEEEYVERAAPVGRGYYGGGGSEGRRESRDAATTGPAYAHAHAHPRFEMGTQQAPDTDLDAFDS